VRTTRIPKAFRFTAAVCALVTSSGSAQAPTGYHVGAGVVIPDSLVEVFAGGRFRATVLRSARTPHERDLIALAERLYPDPETLLAALPDSAYRARVLAMASGKPGVFKVAQRDAGASGDRWWLDHFDATWLPFAVTGGTVDYYLGRLRDLAAGRSPFVLSPKDNGDSGAFEYQATVRPTSDADVAYIVELRIRWDYSCGSLCAVYFRHTRVVWFDAQGKPVRITGDGRPEVIVS
jgi:hypothetical protein